MNFFESPEWFCIQVALLVFVISFCFSCLFLVFRKLKEYIKMLRENEEYFRKMEEKK